MTFRTKIRMLVCALTALVLLFAPAGSVFADGGGHGLEQEVAGHHVQLVLEGKVVTGQNEIAVKLFDAQEQPVSGAEVKLYAEPAEGHKEDEAGEEHSQGEAADEHNEDEAGEAHSQDEAAGEAHSQDEAAGEHNEGEAGDAHADEAEAAASTEPAMSGMGGMEQPQATEAPMEMSASANHAPAEAHAAPQPETGEAHGEMEASAGESTHSETEMENIVFTAGETPGEYRGALDFPESGEWIITVHFVTPDTNASVHFQVEVTNRVNKTAVLGSFAGINAAVIIAAAILKRRSALVKVER